MHINISHIKKVLNVFEPFLMCSFCVKVVVKVLETGFQKIIHCRRSTKLSCDLKIIIECFFYQHLENKEKVWDFKNP